MKANLPDHYSRERSGETKGDHREGKAKEAGQKNRPAANSVGERGPVQDGASLGNEEQRLNETGIVANFCWVASCNGQLRNKLEWHMFNDRVK